MSSGSITQPSRELKSGEPRDLHTLQERHNKLYNEFMRRDPRSKTKEYRSQLVALLHDIKEISPTMPSRDDYLYLRAMVEQWKKAGPALGISIVNVILMPPAPEKLALKTKEEQPEWTDKALKEMLEYRAKELSMYRAVRWSQQMSLDDLVRLHREKTEGEQAERSQMEDWLQAQLYWALDVFKGRFDFVRSLSPDSYHRLEGEDGQIRLWLSDVKKLMAYLNWESRGCGWGVEEAVCDYTRAGQELINHLLDTQQKAPQALFESIQLYLESEYPRSGDGALDTSRERTKRWIEAKGQRLLETGGAQDSGAARAAAEDQMKKFYENVTKAVLGVHEESTRSVAKALGLYSGFERYEAMVDCLEMAIAICFLEPETTRRVLGENVANRAA